MAVTEANAQPLERELIIYEKGIPELLEVDTPLLSLMEKQEADPASNRATRIPLLTQISGTFQQASMNGAALGSTAGPVWNVATLTPIYFTGGYSWTLLAQYATTGAERGVKTVTGEIMRLSIEAFRTQQDMLLNTAGNGVLGTITSVSSVTLTNDTYTLTTDGFKEELFMIGMNVDVYVANLSSKLGTANIIAINRVAHTIQVDATVGSVAGTNKILIGGLTATVTIQSSLFGVPYFQSDATTGLYLGLDRSLVSNVITPSVDAGSSALTTAFIRAALNRIRINLGDKYFNANESKLIAYMHPAQADAYEAIAITMSAIWKDPTGNQEVDLLFNNQNGLKMSNVPVRQSIHQDRTRIDFLDMNFWGRIVATDTGFVKFGDQIIWPQYGSSGTQLVSTAMFYLKAGLQCYNRNPLSGSYIKSLSLPLAGSTSIY